MLEQSYGLSYFLKSSKNQSTTDRYVYIRITVDGIPKETSTKRQWDSTRWNQKTEKAIGTKEDARALNSFLEALTTKINNFKTELLNSDTPITSVDLINFVSGNYKKRNTVLEEFQEHNDEIKSLIESGEYSKGTHERYITARSHVQQFIEYKYKKTDLSFGALNYSFVKDYDLFLKTVRKCSNNTSLKYISNFKKVVLRAVAKEYIPKDPFKLFSGKKTKIKKKPLTKAELKRLESKIFTTKRLEIVRDIFVFQCYTGLSYIDAYQLTWDYIKEGDDGCMWIMSNRQKSKSDTDIPLLPKAMEIIAKYSNDPICIKKGTVLPARSNQKMNEYLKEIATLCEINGTLSTHKARRTFASTVTLNNGVSIHVVKEMLGHYSVKQTEEYAITEQATISREMEILKGKLSNNSSLENIDTKSILTQLQQELEQLKNFGSESNNESFLLRCMVFDAMLNKAKLTMS